MGAIKTYNPKEVVITLGTHIVTGYADDSFITIDPNGDGVTKKVGCDGEVVRSISPDGSRQSEKRPGQSSLDCFLMLKT